MNIVKQKQTPREENKLGVTTGGTGEVGERD